MRPVLKPALHRLWRDPTALQLGIDPRRAVILGGVELDDTGLLDLLDGTRDVGELRDEAARRGHAPGRVDALIKTLRDAAALDDAEPQRAAARVAPWQRPDQLALSLVHPQPGAAAHALAGRRGATVDVIGAGRVGATLAMLLAAAGIGRLRVADNGPVRAADIAPGGIRAGGSRAATRAELTTALLGPAGVVTGRSAQPDAAVLTPTSSVLPPEWLAQVRHRPHLPVVLRETTALIGPFVLPGRTACLRCVELGRSDRDPAWPMLTAQLIGASGGVEASDIALASAAASIAALHVLAWIDQGSAPLPPSIGGIVELSLHDLVLRRRTVTAHPACGCGASDA